MGQDTLRALGLGLGVGSDLATGLSANEQAKRNAAVDRADAAQTMSEARRKAHVIMRQGRGRAAVQKTRAAGSGFTQEGTSLVLQLDELQVAQFNANEIIRSGRAEENRRMQSAANTVRRGKVARTSGILSALGRGVGALGRAERRQEITDAQN